jgi:hypothetical protein
MSPLEDRLRDALHATAATVDERVQRPLPVRGRSRRSRRMLPALAAVAVLLLLIGAVGIRYLTREDRPVLRKVPGIPKFVVAVTPVGKKDPSRLEVRDSKTGRLIDSRRAPGAKSELVRIVGTGDGRTFYAVLGRWPKDKGCRMELLRFVLGTSGTIETMHPTGLSLRSGIGDLALSPDRTKIAFATFGCDVSSGGASSAGDDDMDRPAGEGSGGTIPPGGEGSGSATAAGAPRSNSVEGIAVFDFVSKKRSEWSAGRGYDIDALSWSSHLPGLEFLIGRTDAPTNQLRKIDPSQAPGGSLMKKSSLVFKPYRLTRLDDMQVAPDGRSRFFFTTQYEEKKSKDFQEGPLPGIGAQQESTTLTAASWRVIEVPVGSTTETPLTTGLLRRELDFAGTIRSEPSGHYLLFPGGILDLREGGKPRRVTGFSSANDFAW